MPVDYDEVSRVDVSDVGVDPARADSGPPGHNGEFGETLMDNAIVVDVDVMFLGVFPEAFFHDVPGHIGRGFESDFSY